MFNGEKKLVWNKIKSNSSADGWTVIVFNGFVKYFGFGIKRCDDRIYMQYGLFKKVKYAIPVDKINSVFIKQTLIARFNNK